jgi:hypothetical protein
VQSEIESVLCWPPALGWFPQMGRAWWVVSAKMRRISLRKRYVTTGTSCRPLCGNNLSGWTTNGLSRHSRDEPALKRNVSAVPGGACRLSAAIPLGNARLSQEQPTRYATSAGTTRQVSTGPRRQRPCGGNSSLFSVGNGLISNRNSLRRR